MILRYLDVKLNDHMNFKAVLDNFNTRLWSYHIKVPAAIAQHFIDSGNKRVVCRLNDSVEMQSGLMPAGDGVYFININKKIRDKLKITEGSQLNVNLKNDDSEYGLPMPEEFAEMLKQDNKGNEWFEKLTAGKKRNLIYIAGHVKNVDLRIHRAIVILDHLKMNDGKINFKALNSELKVS